MDKSNNELLQVIRERLIKLYQPCQIYLFGSFAWGIPNTESDLDIAVIVPSSNEKPYKRAQKGILELWDIDKPIDLLVYTTEEFSQYIDHPSTLQHKIKCEGIKLYESAR